MMKNRSLILLRGLPGSGKSTLAALLSDNGKYPVFSVDDYFTDKISGEYKFEFEKNHFAYKACEENTRQAMKNESPKIFVDNTFTIGWEMEPYFKMAGEFDYVVHVATVENYHGSKNIHDIPDDQLKKMAEKYKVKLL
ncbi:MAG: AAA family ATPase [Bacteroidota bacterium]